MEWSNYSNITVGYLEKIFIFLMYWKYKVLSYLV